MSDELEQRLAALHPAELPPALQARLASPPVAPGNIRWLWAASVPLAAAAVFLLMPTVQPSRRPLPTTVRARRGPQISMSLSDLR